MRLFILSGAAKLPPRFLHFAGGVASLIWHPLRDLIRIKNTYNQEARSIRSARKSALAAASISHDGDHASSNFALLDVLRA